MAAYSSWADLPWPLTHQIMSHLSDLLHQDAGSIGLSAATAAVAAASPCRSWRDAAAAALRLHVRCGSTPDELSQLLWLSRRARLVTLHFGGAETEPAAPRTLFTSSPPRIEPPDLIAVFELLRHPAFEAAVGPHLLGLHGAPFDSAAGRRDRLLRFSSLLPAYPRLQTLSLAAGHVASLNEPAHEPAWAAASCLRSLHVCSPHYVAVRVLPPNLQELSVAAWDCLIPPAILVRCPNVRALGPRAALPSRVACGCSSCPNRRLVHML